MSLWIGVHDARSGTMITNASFSYGFYNYSAYGAPGWYWVLMNSPGQLYVAAPGYNSAYFYIPDASGNSSYNLGLVGQTSGGKK